MREALRGIQGLDLRFWGTVQGEHPARLKALMANADMVIVIVSNIRHEAMYAVKEREKLGRLRAVYWTRPLTELPFRHSTGETHDPNTF